jgi:hypothetical protein
MDIDALAALAANTLVAAAVTDAFEGLRAKVAQLFGRDKPDPAVQRRLDATRQQLTAVSPKEIEGKQAAQARQWQTRFADLLADHPEAAEELQSLLAEFTAATRDTGGNVTNTISGTVHGPVLMGRDFGDITLGGRDSLSTDKAEPPSPTSANGPEPEVPAWATALVLPSRQLHPRCDPFACRYARYRPTCRRLASQKDSDPAPGANRLSPIR